jgi:D-alanyl-D-alanine carboxypeptidase
MRFLLIYILGALVWASLFVSCHNDVSSTKDGYNVAEVRLTDSLRHVSERARNKSRVWTEGEDVAYLPTKKHIIEKNDILIVVEKTGNAQMRPPNADTLLRPNHIAINTNIDSLAKNTLALADSLGLALRVKSKKMQDLLVQPKQTSTKGATIASTQKDSTKKNKPLPQPATTQTSSFALKNINTTFLLGRFDPSKHPDFVRIARNYSGRSSLYMQREAYAAFEKMHAAALADGVRLHILSATRSFYQQKVIWDAKWSGKRRASGKNLASASMTDKDKASKILEYSAMPGTSRHHWGTDIDLNNLENSYFESGEGAKVYAWLTAHAAAFGFGQPYSPKGGARPNGYEEEKWHWSYLPLARPILQAYQQMATNHDIAQTPFLGAETAIELDVVNNYVLGIDPLCK